MSTTRILTKEAAFKLLQKGERPTADRVRAAIGQGAQQTILAALDDFWGEVGARLCEPRLPESLVEPVNAIWSQAVVEAGRQWQSERAGFEERIGTLETEKEGLRRELNELREELERRERLADEQRALAARQVARIAEQELTLEERSQRIQSLEEESARLVARRDQLGELLEVEREGRERDQAAWLKEIDAARQALKAANAEKETLTRTLAETRDAKVRQDLLLERAERERSELESRLRTETESREHALAQSADLSRRIERLEAESARDREEIAAWRETLGAKERELAELAETSHGLRLQSERLDAENRILRDQVSALRSDRSEIERFFQQAMARLGEREAVKTQDKDANDGPDATQKTKSTPDVKPTLE
ncbi:DNA-binding protein [Imhoffiella purpurea]|nr:DNA-binding protein [Imhoffiella purpurea]